MVPAAMRASGRFLEPRLDAKVDHGGIGFEKNVRPGGEFHIFRECVAS